MKKIIFAEDDPSILDVVDIALNDKYELTCFTSGKALVNNEFTIPDLFMLDKQLSGTDGLDICRLLKSQDHTRNIPVIIVSAGHNIHVLAREAGANDVLTKPFTMQALRGLIAKYLD